MMVRPYDYVCEQFEPDDLGDCTLPLRELAWMKSWRPKERPCGRRSAPWIRECGGELLGGNLLRFVV
jgi:hypothetical protein